MYFFKRKLIPLSIILHLFACEENKIQDVYSLKDIGLNKNTRKLELTLGNKGEKIFIYLDNANNLIQISSELENKFKVAFNEKGFIGYIKNEYNSNNYQQLWLKDENGVVVFDELDKKIKRRTTLSDTRKLIVAHTSSYFENGNWYLSENKAYDFTEMKIVKHDFIRYIQYEKDVDTLKLNNKNNLNFKIFTNNDKNILLKANFDSEFNFKGKIDSLSIKDRFSYSFIPKNEDDTLRFIIYYFDEFTSLGNSIYYELPLRSK